MKNAIKQELKEKAKKHPVTMGVLAIKNNITRKYFIQGSLNVEALENKIRFSLNTGQYNHKQLQADWKEYGESAFKFECISVVEPQNNPYINYRQEVAKAEKTCIENSEFTTDLY
jgi:hypothetical protein